MADARIEVAISLLLASTVAGMFIVHAIVIRVFKLLGCHSASPQLVAATIIACGNIPIVLTGWVLNSSSPTPRDILASLVYLLVTYNGIGFCYFHLLNASETSLHLHIMLKLLVEGSMRVEDVARRYAIKDMVGARLERMLALGQLKEKDGRFVLNSRNLIIVGRVINTWRRVLGLPLSPRP